jgi:hypothetical protein
VESSTDPATGFIVPKTKRCKTKLALPMLTHANTADRPRRWDGFKSAVYGTVDGIRTLPKKIRIITSRGQNAIKDMGVKEQDINSLEDAQVKDLIVGGYADKAKALTTATRINSDLYQKMNVNLYVGAKPPQEQPPQPVSPEEEPPTVSVFDSVKGAFTQQMIPVEEATKAATATATTTTTTTRRETPDNENLRFIQTLRVSQCPRCTPSCRGLWRILSSMAAAGVNLFSKWELDYYEKYLNRNQKGKRCNLKEASTCSEINWRESIGNLKE